ncbi:MAG: sulfite reductase subunit A [Gammaproteobacteria bacterium]|nr:sulfite reductase subunit A [Gammaproteobacteria bacterium]
MNKCYFLQKNKLQCLFDILITKGFDCMGPQVRDDSIVYASLKEAKQLPWGITDKQGLGEYQLMKGDPQFAFAWTNALMSMKTFLFKPQETAWCVQRDESGRLKFEPVIESKPIALIGVRPCDIAAMLIQDKVFLEGEFIDNRYLARRNALFTVVMNCTAASDNCFCVAAGYSPKAEKGFDLAMTELLDGFVLEAASDAGSKIIGALNLTLATEKQLNQVQTAIQSAKTMQTRSIPSQRTLAKQTARPADDIAWDEVTKQCISCGSCTQVCPTCFCHRTTKLPLMEKEGNEHIRSWDSCFSDDHGYTHSYQFRQGTRSHYQQWLNHKFIYWHQQFDTSGCVGCGRCMTWCPAKIDITDVVGKLYSE